jgi:asparagine synthase (glutamine-hydrolysing)
MCGICGWLSNTSANKIDRSVIESMNATLAHRGPDDEGIAEFARAALAMSRLSVIDLDTGQQPIANGHKNCWIVFNGEIYNYQDIRQQLIARGYQFSTDSDTEVILSAYEEWGEDCVHQLRGMFAFAIYDLRSDKRGRLFIARDRVGKKPLFYTVVDGHFIFGSEIKAILAHPTVPRIVNRQVVPLYLAYGFFPAPFTIFEGIYELPPGHYLAVQNGEVEVNEYWDIRYPHEPDVLGDEGEIIAEVRRLLENAVRIRLMSDVPLGAFLSGGLDSTAIVSYMTRHMNQRVKTFAIGFEDDPTFNELEYARLVAREYRTDHHEFIVRPNAIDLLPKLVWHHDQPFGDSSAIPTYLLSKLTRSHVTVALTGDGGDELFAGYERFVATRLAEAYRDAPLFVRLVLSGLLRSLPESASYDSFVRRARRFIEYAPLPLSLGYLGWVGVFQKDFVGDLLDNWAGMDPAVHFQSYFDRVQAVDPIGQLLYVNTKTYLPGDLLVKTDRMCMANSLEARSPFLDQELMAYAARISSDVKLKGITTKYILKKALQGIVPEEIIRRKKHGFGVPVGRWFRDDLHDYITEILLSDQSLRRGYFKRDMLKRLVEEHQTGQRDHTHRLWTLLTFEIWHRVVLENGSV